MGLRKVDKSQYLANMNELGWVMFSIDLEENMCFGRFAFFKFLIRVQMVKVQNIQYLRYHKIP